MWIDKRTVESIAPRNNRKPFLYVPSIQAARTLDRSRRRANQELVFICAVLVQFEIRAQSWLEEEELRNKVPALVAPDLGFHPFLARPSLSPSGNAVHVLRNLGWLTSRVVHRAYPYGWESVVIPSNRIVQHFPLLEVQR